MSLTRVLLVVALGACVGLSPAAIAMAGAQSLPEPAPVFEVDPTWPSLPNDWVISAVSKISVDSHDNVWLIHRPRSVPVGKVAAPAVVALGQDGRVVHAWGGEGAGYDWPDVEHNIFVDRNDNVYISGSSPGGRSQTTRSDDMILKFTADGKFLKQFGGRTVSKGSLDKASVNKPGDFFVWPKTNELFVADGYGNRRVLVLDATTLAVKRMWGAFGKPPADSTSSGGPGANGGHAPQPGQPAAPAAAPAVLDTEGPGPERFAGPVHGILVSDDGVVYVADRTNRRVQIFTPSGKYLAEMFLNRAGPAPESVSGMALSSDPAQKFLYLSDFGNSRIAAVDRKTLKILYQFGRRGPEPGNFQGIHHIAVDSKGNLYTGEVVPGSRAQKFVFKGVSETPPPNALTKDQLAPAPQGPT